MKIPRNIFTRTITHTHWKLRETFTNHNRYRFLNAALRTKILEKIGISNPKEVYRDRACGLYDDYTRMFMRAGNKLFCASGGNFSSEPAKFYAIDFYILPLEDQPEDVGLVQLARKAHWAGL